MKRELQATLLGRYGSMLKTNLECDNGWYNLIEDMLAQLQTRNPTCKITTIKEKFGTLRVYGNFSEDGAPIISAARATSNSTCEVCGDEGSLRNIRGWFRTICDAHLPENKIRQG
jgi:hypothetical protein